MKKTEPAKTKTIVKIVLLKTLILFYTSTLYAETAVPLGKKGTKQCGINLGYGYSLELKSDPRFASIYPYFGKIMTDTVGQGWLRGNVEGIIEGAFSYVHKNQNTYSSGVNLLARYKLLPSSDNGSHIYREALVSYIQISGSIISDLILTLRLMPQVVYSIFSIRKTE